MFTQPVGNYYRSEQFLYRSSSILSLFLKNTIGLRFFLSLSFRVHLPRSTSMRLRLQLEVRRVAPARIQPSTQPLSRFDHDGQLRLRRPSPALSARLL